jgi:hypothetical protein
LSSSSSSSRVSSLSVSGSFTDFDGSFAARSCEPVRPKGVNMRMALSNISRL